MTDQPDSRIAELIDLATTEGRPLAVRAETVCALEDAGWMVEPFTGQLWREDPSCLPPALALRYLVNALQRADPRLLPNFVAPAPVAEDAGEWEEDELRGQP